MAQDHGLCRKKVSQQMNRRTGRLCRPVLQLPTGQFSQLANMLVYVDPGAHGMNRGKQSKMNGRGKNVEGSGHDMAKGKGKQANKACRTRQLQADTAGRLSVRHRPQNNSQQLAGLAARTTAARGCRLASRRAVQVDGGSAVVLALKKAGSDLPNVPTPPIAFACHCPDPLP